MIRARTKAIKGEGEAKGSGLKEKEGREYIEEKSIRESKSNIAGMGELPIVIRGNSINLEA